MCKFQVVAIAGILISIVANSSDAVEPVAKLRLVENPDVMFMTNQTNESRRPTLANPRAERLQQLSAETFQVYTKEEVDAQINAVVERQKALEQQLKTLIDELKRYDRGE